MQFRGQYGFLSNMSDSPMRIRRKGETQAYTFKNLEAAFQAMKCPERMAEFQNLTGPEAKQLGKTVQLRPDWDQIKLGVMQALVKTKFDQNPALKQKLMATAGTQLVEENAWHDTYWGTCNGVGENNLGKILMATRDAYQAEAQTQMTAQTKAPTQPQTQPKAQPNRPYYPPEPQPAQASQPQTQDQHNKIKPVEGYKTLCFTGPRPKNIIQQTDPNQRSQAYNIEMYREFAYGMTQYLDGMYDAGVRTFISGGAQGFDQIAFWAVNALKTKHPDIQNILCAPDSDYGISWPNWAPNGLFSKAEYKQMLDTADQVVYTDRMLDCAGMSKPQILQRRNEAMVNNADMVIALFQDPAGLDATLSKPSGTMNCMRYAHNHGLPIYQISYTNDPTGKIIPNGQVTVIPPLAGTTTPQAAATRDMSDLERKAGEIQPDPASTDYGNPIF